MQERLPERRPQISTADKVIQVIVLSRSASAAAAALIAALTTEPGKAVVPATAAIVGAVTAKVHRRSAENEAQKRQEKK